MRVPTGSAPVPNSPAPVPTGPARVLRPNVPAWSRPVVEESVERLARLEAGGVARGAGFRWLGWLTRWAGPLSLAAPFVEFARDAHQYAAIYEEAERERWLTTVFASPMIEEYPPTTLVLSPAMPKLVPEPLFVEKKGVPLPPASGNQVARASADAPPAAPSSDPVFDELDKLRAKKERDGKPFDLRKVTPEMIARMTPAEQIAVARNCFEAYRAKAIELFHALMASQNPEEWQQRWTDFRTETDYLLALDKIPGTSEVATLYRSIFYSMKPFAKVAQTAEAVRVLRERGVERGEPYSWDDARALLRGAADLETQVRHRWLKTGIFYEATPGYHELAANIFRFLMGNFTVCTPLPDGSGYLFSGLIPAMKRTYGTNPNFWPPWPNVDLNLGVPLDMLGWSHQIRTIKDDSGAFRDIEFRLTFKKP
ncbi:MAG: hypothetical protein HYS22_03995 [Deltaproteobacteria bacterium]|nr:hypothetical protein [Deltaproteobacteria bacterium]